MGAGYLFSCENTWANGNRNQRMMSPPSTEMDWPVT